MNFFRTFIILFLDDCVDGSQSCPGVADLCNQAQYKDTLSQYCRATCKLCTPSDNATSDTSKSTPGKCENQFENCDPMKFLCDDKENAYSERYYNNARNRFCSFD